MKKIVLSIALSACSLTVSANEPQYYFVVPLNGVVSSGSTSEPEITYTEEERLAAWDSFASTNGLTYGADWSSISWYSKSLASIPIEPYPNSLPYAIYLQGNSISDISGLSGITSVTQHLDLNSNSITDISELSSLTEVGGRLYLHGNQLTSLTGLENYTGGTYLHAYNNPQLEDVSAIQNANALGELKLDARKYTTRMPEASALCQAISAGQTDLLSASAAILPKGTVCVVASEWEEFAADNLQLDYDANWSTINWMNESLTSIPTEAYPNSTPYALYFSGNSISDISGLSNITSITQHFYLNDNSLSDISYLSNLTEVGGRLYLHGNQLTSLAGLENYTGGAYLHAYNNPQLEDVSAIQNANALGELKLDARKYTTRMPEASALCQAISAGQTDLLSASAAILPKGTVCAVTSEWEEFAADNLQLDYNASWSTINWMNESLTSIPTEAYPNSTPYAIYLNGNSITDISGLSNITSFTQHFYLNDNGLSDISGLSNLTQVGGSFFLNGNQLTSLAGLENYTGGTKLYIYNNPLLEDLTAIQNANTLGELRIDNREYTTRMPMASPLCQDISGGQTSLTNSSGSAMPISHVCQ